MPEHLQEPEHTKLYTVSAGGYSAVADAFAFHNESKTLWFLSMIGPQTSVKAIAATLMKMPPGQAHFIKGTDNTELEGPIVSTIPSHETTGTWTSRTQRIKDNAFHTILYTKWAEHSSDSQRFVILPKTDESAPGLYYQYLDRRTPLPLHHTWTEWLWERGLLSPREIQPLHSSGLKGYLCTPDHEALRRDVSLAVAMGILTIPGESPNPGDTAGQQASAAEPTITANGHHPL